MKLILSKNHELTLTPEQSSAFQDEMRYACNQLSVFPCMEQILELMRS
jgi:hypothetical protein